ncbi:hypothetical protein F0562_010506 [Nyssa sinensis]|uniref:Cytochrome P450 CYP72A219-like n=1 Tax=Nyssa sinensis TaxID=561372 RepID=A0A5J5A1J9_9ASTE|nr:hypothetical protein F0562_010506 [Nyssa sinensis]
MEMKLSSVAVSFVLVAFLWFVWRFMDWLWLRPMKIERCLRQQGLKGNPYRLFYGDSKDIYKMSKEARCKPINLSHDILPRVLPFHYHSIKEYGKNYFTWLGPVPRVNIMDPELINDILNKNNIFKKVNQNPLHNLLVAGVGSYEDEKWAKHRKIVNPAFYLEKLKDMLPAMHLSCSEMMSKWEVLVSEKGSCELDVWPNLHNLACDVISRTSFGSSYEEGRRIFELQKEQAQLAQEVFDSFYIPGWRFLPTKRNKRMKKNYQDVQALLRGIINKRERAMKLGEAGANDLLGLLLKSNLKEIKEQGNDKNAGMTIEEVIEECKLFYFAGQETTANLLVWTMVLLSMHQNWQVKAREEVWQFFGNNKPDYEGLNRLKIVTMILNEVLRLYPPAIVVTRVIHKETKLGEMTLPAGVQFFLPIISVHRDPELWGEDAKEFKPERFSEGVANATKNPASFFPFSWGPRICVGNNFSLMEAKLTLAMILQRFSFELSPSYTHAPSFVVTLQPQNGAHMILHKI